MNNCRHNSHLHEYCDNSPRYIKSNTLILIFAKLTSTSWITDTHALSHLAPASTPHHLDRQADRVRQGTGNRGVTTDASRRQSHWRARYTQKKFWLALWHDRRGQHTRSHSFGMCPCIGGRHTPSFRPSPTHPRKPPQHQTPATPR